jgi:Gti1/Pac2 family transcription factor
MSHQTNNNLEPTYQGYISNTLDALLIFEACLRGALHHVSRRPHDKERADLIKSGYIFVYEEHSSGIKRWTDGVSWSPSRILNNFLIYRELDRPFPPGEKKRALKRAQKKPSDGGISKNSFQPRRLSPPSLPSSASLQDSISASTSTPPTNGSSAPIKDQERALIGSLVDSYDFKENGRVKKTISITYKGIQHHLVSYYNLDDVTGGNLMQPSRDPELQGLTIRHELLGSQNFRAPLEEMEYLGDSTSYHLVQGAPYSSFNGMLTHAIQRMPYAAAPESTEELFHYALPGSSHHTPHVPHLQSAPSTGYVPSQYGYGQPVPSFQGHQHQQSLFSYSQPSASTPQHPSSDYSDHQQSSEYSQHQSSGFPGQHLAFPSPGAMPVDPVSGMADLHSAPSNDTTHGFAMDDNYRYPYGGEEAFASQSLGS